MTRLHFFGATSAFAVFISFTLVSPAFAHAHLRSAQPPVDGNVRADVQDLRITYSEAVEPRFCQVQVTAPDGKAVDGSKPQTDPADAKIGVVRNPPFLGYTGERKPSAFKAEFWL